MLILKTLARLGALITFACIKTYKKLGNAAAAAEAYARTSSSSGEVARILPLIEGLYLRESYLTSQTGTGSSSVGKPHCRTIAFSGLLLGMMYQVPLDGRHTA